MRRQQNSDFEPWERAGLSSNPPPHSRAFAPHTMAKGTGDREVRHAVSLHSSGVASTDTACGNSSC
eukprot:2402055-Rhodomonas_salina.2